jgi:RimJ/RimL family protein N-acetyltransferase
VIRVESPFPTEAWPRVWFWMDAFRGRVTDDFSPKSIEEFVAGAIASSEIEGVTTWGVWRGDELGGMVSIRRLDARVATAQSLFKSQFWGESEDALRQVYAEVFASGIEKLCSQAFPDNHQILALAQGLGAEVEGRLRRQTVRGGKPADILELGLLQEDFERCSRK